MPATAISPASTKGQSQNPGPSPSQALFQTIGLRPQGRAMLFGYSGAGKSVLAERLIEHFTLDRKSPRVLILDGKPRFRGQWELSGYSAARRYKKWRRGPTMPDSVVLNILDDPAEQLRAAWTLGATTAIAQTDDPNLIPLLRGFGRAFYQGSQDKYDQLLYSDETADFFGTTGSASRGDALLQVVRSGRERNVAFLGAAQRPKGLPHSFLTELGQAYIFRLDSAGDLKHLEDMGLPMDALPPEEDYVFRYFDKKTRTHGKFRLSQQLADHGLRGTL